MKFVMEELFGMGGIGFIYTGPISGILTYLIVIAIVIFAIIGLVTTIKWIIRLIIGGNNKKETPGERWLRTGRMK